MDGLLTAALSSIPQLAGAGGLAFLVILLLRREGTELARERAAHDADLVQRDAEIESLRGRLQLAENEVDAQRRLRREAEDAASGRHRAPGPL